MAQRHPLPRSGSLAMPFGTLFLPCYPEDLPFLKLAIPSLKSPRASRFALLALLCLPVSQSPEQGTPIPEGWKLGAGVPTFPPQSQSPQEPSAGTGTRNVCDAGVRGGCSQRFLTPSLPASALQQAGPSAAPR